MVGKVIQYCHSGIFTSLWYNFHFQIMHTGDRFKSLYTIFLLFLFCYNEEGVNITFQTMQCFGDFLNKLNTLLKKLKSIFTRNVKWALSCLFQYTRSRDSGQYQNKKNTKKKWLKRQNSFLYNLSVMRVNPSWCKVKRWGCAGKRMGGGKVNCDWWLVSHPRSLTDPV